MRQFLILLVTLFVVGCAQKPEPIVETAVPTVTSIPTTTPTELIMPTVAPTETAVPETPTPFPTPTPTPIPTPIMYTIQEGETLLGIAIAQGTTTEDILALNPDLRPEALQIGQTFILPPKDTAVTIPNAETSVNAPIPAQIEIGQTQTYDTPVGGFWVVGEIKNEGNQAVENVQVEIRFLDEQGDVQNRAVTWVANPIIEAGATAPFALLLAQRPTYAQIETAVIAGNSVTELGERYLDLQLMDLSLNHDQPALQMSESVQNVGAETAVSIQIIMSLYDQDGGLAGFIIHELEEPMLAGEVRPFTETAVSLGLPIETISVSFFAYRLIVDTQ